MKHMIHSTTGVLLAGLIATGCSTAPPADKVAAADAALGTAAQAVNQASGNPHVAKYASSELEAANTSLEKAKEAWERKEDLPDTTQFAYIAKQRAATAEELANARAAEEAVTLAALERDRAVQVAAAQAPARRAAEPGARSPRALQVTQAVAGFAVGSAKLPASASPMLDGMVSNLKEHPDRVIVIAGHADNTGDTRYNDVLAMQRAEAVRSALLKRGVDPARVAIRSFGEASPVASNDNVAGRQENRRVDAIIAEGDPQMVGSTQGKTSTTGSGKDEPKKKPKK
ncbi:MAG: DUF4398 domain-containing protein [Lysobacteraceae bacterium]|nr:MAG: DUF4398 domain-containing protein [Xanthomonadaceae bacterium]